MRRNWLHVGFVFAGMVLVFLIKNLNPPTMDYQIDTITTVDCVGENLSGITYNAESNTYFVITNSPEELVQITPSGDCIQSYSLDKFEDTEDIFHVTANQFLVVQERRSTLDVIELGDNEVRHLQSLSFNLDGEVNEGLEGVVYDAVKNEIHLVTEFPQQILKISNWQPMQPINELDELHSFWAPRMMGDYSSITDCNDGLLVLSHESNRLLKLDYKGKIKASLDLIDESATTEDFVQAEGVTIDSDGNIYIVSEPNQLHIYKKKPATGAGFLAFANE